MSQGCLVCDKPGLSLSKSVINIFADTSSHGKPLADLLSEIIEKPIKEGGVHSNLLCTKCLKAVSDYDSVKVRLETIKTCLLSEFKKTLPKHDLDYETFALQIPKTPIKSPIANTNKSPLKTLVLPASKLQPVPADYVINVNGLSASIHLGTTKVCLPKVTPMPSKTPISNSLQKVTTNSSVFTHIVKTLSPNTTSSVQSIALANSPTNIVNSTKTTEISESEKLTEVNINELLNKKCDSMMNFNVNSLPKDFMSSSVMRDDEVKKEADASNDSMDIDNDCTLAKVIDKNSENNIESEGEKTASTVNPKRQYVLDVSDVTLERIGGIVNRNVDDDGDGENDDEYQHTIVMSSEDASILRVMSGQKFMYDGGEVSLVMPDGDDDDDDANDHDSNDESQIELQVSGDEETANAIIAAARDQGGAFIKVGSGEMYRLKSVISEVKNDNGGKDSTIEDKTEQELVVWENNKFKCTLCDLEDGDPLSVCSGDATFISKHMQSAHNMTVYICGACHLAFIKYKLYCEHVDKHENDSEKTNKSKIHECAICSKKYSSKSQLREHLNTHTGAKPHVCVVCKKAFASKYTHQAHMKTHSDRTRPFKCSRCGKAFFTQQNLQQHERTHLGVKSFLCKVCGKAFGTAHNLEVHGVVHSGERPFACARCGRAFARRAELRDHARTHTGERPFKCDLCDASFAQRSNLHSHKRATHFDDKRYQCNECPKKFKRRRLLEYHIKASHTGERPLECEICHATFVYPEHYKKHLRIHSGERPFVCEVCGKAFNSRDNRNTHRFVHSDKKPYECLVCGAGYMRKQLLYAHMSAAGHLAESIVVNQPRVQKVKSAEASETVLDAIKSTDKLDTLFENAEELQLETSDGKSVTGFEITTDADGKIYLTGTGDRKLLLQDGKDSLKLVQDIDETALLTLQNTESNVKTDSGILQGAMLDQLVGQSQAESGDGGDLLRLVQVQLPDGGSGWLALNH